MPAFLAHAVPLLNTNCIGQKQVHLITIKAKVNLSFESFAREGDRPNLPSHV
jgi:hypothetical protein